MNQPKDCLKNMNQLFLDMCTANRSYTRENNVSKANRTALLSLLGVEQLPISSTEWSEEIGAKETLKKSRALVFLNRGKILHRATYTVHILIKQESCPSARVSPLLCVRYVFYSHKYI